MLRNIGFLLSAVLYIALHNDAMALSSETNICIRNTTNKNHYLEAVDIDNYYWDGNSRPDKNFSNISIGGGETICKREEVNATAVSSGFTFLVDGNPTKMQFLNTQINNSDDSGYMYKEPRWGAFTNNSNPTSLHGEKTIYFQPSDWWVGYSCDGVSCTLFELR